MTTQSSDVREGGPWQSTACILCSVNCGIEAQTGGEGGRRILKVHGDPRHPNSKGYLCEKAQRLDHYQNGADRLTSPMRRRPDGTYEAISWDTAIREVAAKLVAVKERHGGAKILYYGGGGQGNHLGGAYCDATLKALGVKFRSNALAQEKTGEFWVQGKMFGTGTHPDFERCEVALFIGKNPWQSHGFARARVVINEIAKDPERCLIVIDPRKSETAAKADIHLAIAPGTDAWCLAALVAIVVQEKLVRREWLGDHATGLAEIEAAFGALDVAALASVCAVDEALLRTVARKVAKAKSASVLEDLGLQMNVHSTLSSYLQRLFWVLCGHYGREGTSNAFVPFLSLSKASKGETSGGTRGKRAEKKSPVVGAKVIIGLIPCNVIPDEILTDHPDRFRALIVDSGNPVHSLADSQRMREAFRKLEVSVVIDVAMTETARQADYVLPASSQFEKAEATFFNLEFPRNAFHLRRPLFEPLEGTLPEGEIHARLLEAMGELSARDYLPLRLALRAGRAAFAVAFAAMQAVNPRIARYASVVLYRTLGETLPKPMKNAAVVWGVAQMFVMSHRAAAARAGFAGLPPVAANALFDAMLMNPSGVVFAERTFAESWEAITMADHKINLRIPELLPEVAKLPGSKPPSDPEFPFVLAAGERRSDTSNTAVRDASWHKKGRYGTLRMHPDDAQKLGVTDGSRVRVTTRRGSVEVEAELTDAMRRGSVSLPNGQGLDYRDSSGALVRKGAAPNELTDNKSRDPVAGTPWHKYVPARVEPL
ncbi:MAG: molybdopterin oxidoreductase family protein [Myxococcales bacterium]|nr:molybdopterin oxidoreductase family protein [Myxococcales bacterium]